MPTAKDRAELRLTLTQKGSDQPPKNLPDKVFVKLFMPSMGHGSLPTTVVPEVDTSNKSIPGSYLVKDLYFSMGGKWEIQFELKKSGKVVDKATFPFSL
jgi:hypothetical protein